MGFLIVAHILQITKIIFFYIIIFLLSYFCISSIFGELWTALNGTIWSQLVRVMYLSHHYFLKIAKMGQKKSEAAFRINLDIMGNSVSV